MLKSNRKKKNLPVFPITLTTAELDPLSHQLIYLCLQFFSNFQTMEIRKGDNDCLETIVY